MAPAMIEVARLHAHESRLSIDYELCSAEAVRRRAPAEPGVRRDHLHGADRARAEPRVACWRPSRGCCGPAGSCSSRPSTAICALSCSPSSVPSTCCGCCRAARTNMPGCCARPSSRALARAQGSALCEPVGHPVQPAPAQRAAQPDRGHQLSGLHLRQPGMTGASRDRPAAAAARAAPCPRSRLCSTWTARCSTPHRNSARAQSHCAPSSSCAPLTLAAVRPHVSHGSGAMVRPAFRTPMTGASRRCGRASWICIAPSLVVDTRLFAGFEAVLADARCTPHALGHRDQQARLAHRAAARPLGLRARARLRDVRRHPAGQKTRPAPLLTAARELGRRPGATASISATPFAMRRRHAPRRCSRSGRASAISARRRSSTAGRWTVGSTTPLELMAWIGLRGPSAPRHREPTSR